MMEQTFAFNIYIPDRTATYSNYIRELKELFIYFFAILTVNICQLKAVVLL